MTTHTPATQRIQSRLERWELEHLRQHAAELAERLEHVESRLASSEDYAEWWREQALRLDDPDAPPMALTRSGTLYRLHEPRDQGPAQSFIDPQWGGADLPFV